MENLSVFEGTVGTVCIWEKIKKKRPSNVFMALCGAYTVHSLFKTIDYPSSSPSNIKFSPAGATVNCDDIYRFSTCSSDLLYVFNEYIATGNIEKLCPGTDVSDDDDSSSLYDNVFKSYKLYLDYEEKVFKYMRDECRVESGTHVVGVENSYICGRLLTFVV